ncbi:MAG: hydroxyethylthiazole kinase [Thermoplasmata archaeon]
MNIYEDLEKIRRKRPLIHHITNFVVMNDSANITLALGASPIMAHAKEELEDLINIADVLYINIGTLDSFWIDSMYLSLKYSEKYDKPVLLDPVGSGASKLRTQISLKLLESSSIKILKGNAGEILSLYGEKGKVKGVDSISEGNINVVEELALKYNKTVISTGKFDYVSDGKRKAIVKNGTEMFEKITGSGCMLGSVISSFMAVNRDYFESSIEGLLTFEIAGELAEKFSSGPGSFKVNLMDAINSINVNDYNLARVDYL